MNNLMRTVIIIAAIIYIISPVDAMIGPIDDIIVMMLTYASQKKLTDNN